MTARRCGAQAALFGPRPDPCPERLKPVAGRLTEWFGPVVPPAQLPRFEIFYRRGETEYLQASLDAEVMGSPTMLPTDPSGFDHVDHRSSLPRKVETQSERIHHGHLLSPSF
jgi:hypothetical protein